MWVGFYVLIINVFGYVLWFILNYQYGNNKSIDVCVVKKIGIYCIMIFIKFEGNDNYCMYEILFIKIKVQQDFYFNMQIMLDVRYVYIICIYKC